MRLLGLPSGPEIDQKFSQLHQDLDRQNEAVNRKLEEIDEKIKNQSNSLNQKLEELAQELTQHLSRSADSALLGERTHNAFHADYEKKLVRASPGKIFNRDKPCANPAFVELLKQANGDEVADGAWERMLAEALVEASSVPGAVQVFERQAYIENYLSG